MGAYAAPKARSREPIEWNAIGTPVAFMSSNGPELRSEQLATDRFDRRHVCHLFLGEPRRLVQVGYEETIDGESRPVGSVNLDFPVAIRDRLERRDGRCRGSGASHHLDQPVDRRGIEEVESRESLGVRERFLQPRDGERLGIRDHRVVGDDRGQLVEERPLDLFFLEDGFDHQAGLSRHRGHIRGEEDPARARHSVARR